MDITQIEFPGVIVDFAHGSVIGRDHLYCGRVLVGRNNQDAVYCARSSNAFVAVVCDGCSGGEHSEVGATLAARLLAVTIADYAETMPDALAVKRASEWVEAEIRILANRLGDSLSQTVQDHFLFATMILIIRHDGSDAWAKMFSLGDCVWAVDTPYSLFKSGLMTTGPYPGNAPPYLGYKLVGSSIDPKLLDFAPSFCVKVRADANVIIGSDGLMDFESASKELIPGTKKRVGSIWQFFDDRYYTNPQAANRLLHRVNTTVTRVGEDGRLCRTSGLLPDDTTFFAARLRKTDAK